MTLSQHGEDLLVAREGEILKVYLDSKDLPTMGVGHLLTPAEKRKYPVGTKITREFSRQLFRKDVAASEAAVNDNVRVPLKQNQFDALVSLIFNIGVEAFKRSTVLRRLNEKDYARAANAFLLWNQPPEIRGRRSKEFAQFKTPYVTTSLAPDPAPAVSADAASDPKGDGGTQTNPTNPSPSITFDNAITQADRLAMLRDRLLGWKVIMPTKSVGWLTLVDGFYQSNKILIWIGLGLVAVSLVLLYFNRRQK